MSVAQQQKQMGHEAFQIIRERWREVIRQSAIGLAITCFGPGREALAQSLPEGEKAAFFWSTLFPLTQNLVVWLAVLMGSFVLVKTSEVETAVKILFFSALILILLPSASALGYSRFRVHAVPLMCIFASIGISKIVTSLRPKL